MRSQNKNWIIYCMVLLDVGGLILEMATTKVLLLLETDTGPRRGDKSTEHRNIVYNNMLHLMRS